MWRVLCYALAYAVENFFELVEFKLFSLISVQVQLAIFVPQTRQANLTSYRIFPLDISIKKSGDAIASLIIYDAIDI